MAKVIDFNKIEAVDLFCGVGGLTHGIEKTGINVLAGIDIDPTCKYAYETNNNAKFILSDIAEYNSSDLLKLYTNESVRLLMGCAPCQPFSKLQKNNIDKNIDSKWGLLYSFLNHIKSTNPHIISMENVPELEKEQVFLDFKNQIIALGYKVDYKVVDSSEYGVPQRRKRLLFLASIFGNIELLEPNHKDNKITLRDAIYNLPPIKAGESSEIDPLHKASSLSSINLRRIQNSVPGGTWKDWPEDLLLECYKKKSGQSFTSVYGRMTWDDVSPTLTTQFNRYGTGRYGHPEQDRALSLREGAILQSFPRDYQFVQNSNYVIGDIARQIGNAVPVKLGEVIGLSVLRHIQSLEVV